MSAQILSLAPAAPDPAKIAGSAETAAEQLQDAEDGRLAPSRGIVFGVLVSLPVWLIGGIVIYLVL